MKNIILCLLTLVCPPVSAIDITGWVTFNFSEPEQLNIQPALSSRDLDYLKGSGDVLNITDRTISADSVTVSFDKGEGREGVAINHLLLESDTSVSEYSLSMRTKGILFVSVPYGCTIDSVVFDGAMANVTKMPSHPGIFNVAMKTWSPNGESVTRVGFQNGQSYDTRISSVKVKFTRPAVPLYMKSSKPENNATDLKTIDSILMQFNMPITSVLKPDAPYMTDPGGSQSPLTVSCSGSNVTLTPTKTVDATGPYTVTVPAGTFQNEEGSVNNDIIVKYKVRIPIMPVTVTPNPEDTIQVLPDTITLRFDKTVVLKENSYAVIYFDDAYLEVPVEIVRNEIDKKEIILIMPKDDIDQTQEGKWTVRVLQGTIHNTYYQYNDPDRDSWNDDIDLNYTVFIPLLPEMIQAQELVKKSGIGYPATDSQVRKDLETVIAKGHAATVEELTSAMEAFYIESDDLEMPVDGSWYHIVGLNSAAEPSRVYLTIADKHVTLTKDSIKATPFQLVMHEDKMMFRTDDKKYLHVLSTRKDLMGTMGAAADDVTNLTEKESFVNYLTVGRLDYAGADSTMTLGKLSITGTLLTVEDKRDTVMMAINHTDATIVNCLPGEVVYDEEESCAFTFISAVPPFDTDVDTYPEAFFCEGSSVYIGNTLTLTVKNAKTVTLADSKKPYITKNGERLEIESDVLTPTSAACEFMVNTTSLEVGSYELVLPEGTFTYEKLDKNVFDKEMSVAFTIIPVPDPPFQYTYNDRFAYLQELQRLERNVTVIADTELNDFVLFAVIDNPYSAMIPNPEKTVRIENYYSGKLYATGHLEPYPDFTNDYDYPFTQAVRLVLDEPIKSGDVGIATVAYVLPKGTIGDANYGKWLENPESVAPEECIVNDKIDNILVLVNNDLATQGIHEANSVQNKKYFYDLTGRKTIGKVSSGIYIINGKKHVVR